MPQSPDSGNRPGRRELLKSAGKVGLLVAAAGAIRGAFAAAQGTISGEPPYQPITTNAKTESAAITKQEPVESLYNYLVNDVSYGKTQKESILEDIRKRQSAIRAARDPDDKRQDIILDAYVQIENAA